MDSLEASFHNHPYHRHQDMGYTLYLLDPDTYMRPSVKLCHFKNNKYVGTFYYGILISSKPGDFITVSKETYVLPDNILKGSFDEKSSYFFTIIEFLI